jgi:uncharacterized protein YqgV (UPF0045/DUF77 family)
MASAQISVYPLRQERLDKAVEIVLNALAARGLEPEVGAMSTLVNGESDRIFAALAAAYREAARAGPVVMAVTVSNTCPVPA